MNVFSDTYDFLFDFKNDESTMLKNKLRILCYTLANSMLLECLPELNEQFNLKKISSEEELFSIKLLKRNALPIVTNLTKENRIHINEIEIYNSLGYAYDLLINNFNLTINSEFKVNYISFDNIKEKIGIVVKDPLKIKILGSLILDVFIDNGVIVPRVKFNDNHLVRIFKFGEVAKLTANDFVMFAMVLAQYSNLLKRGLDKTEIEKVSVIFFRRYNNNFNLENNEAEAFRICYSKFGPRISSSDVQYSISQGQALTDILIESGFITKIGDKYDVCPLSQREELNNVNQLQRSLFTGKLQKLNEYYLLAQKTYTNNEVFKYINSYIRLLTLISIGGSKQDKLLSLIAEVDLIKSRTISKHEDLSIVANVLNSIIDGVLSGVWKYYCYKNNGLQDIFKLICEVSMEENKMYAIDIFLEIVASEECIVEENFFFEIGQFLYDVALFNMCLCKYINTKVHEDYSRLPYKHCLNTKMFNDILEKYKQIFSSEKKDEIEHFIFNHIKKIDNTSCRLMDKYHVYNATLSLQCETFSECVVIFNYEQNDIVEKTFPDLQTYKYESLLIIPFKKENKEFVLNQICKTLDSVNIKALYYSSNDEDIVLYSTPTDLYGKKFIEEIQNAVKFVYKNIQPARSKEFLVLPKKEFTARGFCVEDFSFEYVEQITFSNERNIYKYNFKEKKSMNVTTLIVNGNMYNVEQVSGDFNLLYDKCTDTTIQEQIKTAKEATEKKDVSKLQACLTWLKENAFDFIKEVGTGVLIELINSGITQ